MSDRVLTAHVPQQLAKEVDQLAERLDRPRAWIVKEALERFVALELRRHELTLEALADVDEGRTVDHAGMVAWAKGLDTKARKKRPR